MEITPDIFIEGIARAVTQWLETQPDVAERLLTRMAELRCELLTPADLSEMIGLEVKTIRANFRAYGFEKSTALGPNEPRYFRSQIVEAMKREGKLIKASSGEQVEKAKTDLAKKITPFPKRSAPTVAPPAKLTAT